MGVGYIIPPAGTPASQFHGQEFVAPAKSPAILARKIDANTGALLSLFEGMHPVDSNIALEFRLRRGSGVAVQDRGNRLREIRKNTEDAPKMIESEMRRIAQPFLDAGDVQIVTLEVDAGEGSGDTGAASLCYRNLRTGKEGRIVK